MICGNFCMGGLFLGNKGQQRHGQVVLHVLTRVLILELVELVVHLFGHCSHRLFIFGFYLQPVCSVAYRQVYRNQILHFRNIYITILLGFPSRVKMVKFAVKRKKTFIPGKVLFAGKG